MGREVDLLRSYPRTKRNIEERIKTKSEKSREIARKFGEEFFDGDREHGYGGFAYNPKFWTGVVSDLIDEYHLNNQSSVLDVGCAKGFLLHDLKIALPGIKVKGIDVSDYAIMNSIDTVKTDLLVASADNLPFADNSFDLVLSINTIHNLDRSNCSDALKEINRVTKRYSFITVDAYRNEEERIRMEAWNLTAKTMMSCNEWISFFKEVKYTGDYYWFIP